MKHKAPWQDRSAEFWRKEFGSAARLPEDVDQRTVSRMLSELDGTGLRFRKAPRAADHGPGPGVSPTPPSPPPPGATPSPFRTPSSVVRKGSRRSTRDQVVAVLRDFMENAYISGLPFIVRRNIGLCDRWLWIAVVLLGATLAVKDLPAMYEAQRNNPTRVSVSRLGRNAQEIPFPAVTICPKMKIRKSAAFEYLRAARNVTSFNEIALLPALRFLQSFRLPYELIPEKMDFPPDVVAVFQGLNLTDFMDKVGVDCKSLFLTCFWVGQPVDCCQHFSRIMTNSGWCFGFNSFLTIDKERVCGPIPGNLTVVRDKMNSWYNHHPTTGPCTVVRSSNTGIFTGLEVFTRPSDPLDHLDATAASRGYELTVQAPNDMPDLSRSVHVTEHRPRDTMRYMMTARVKYSETITYRCMASVPAEKRKCRFEVEIPEQMTALGFGWYTEVGCLIGCRVSFLFKRCGCYPYFAYHMSPQCSLPQYACITHHARRLLWIQAPIGPPPAQLTEEEAEGCLWPDCRHCLPSCASSAYNGIFKTKLVSYLRAPNASAHINVYHNDQRAAILYIEKQNMYSTDYLVKFGANFNIFLGMSLISVVQITMYFGEVLLVLLRSAWLRITQAVWGGRRRPGAGGGGAGQGRRSTRRITKEAKRLQRVRTRLPAFVE